MTTEVLAGGEEEAAECARDAQQSAVMSRNERRKAAKKEKRKQRRREVAAKEREEEAARLEDPEEQRRIQLEEEMENERLERERKEFEVRERMFLEALAAKRKADEEEEERRRILEEESKQNEVENTDENEDNEWEYLEEGPPEIIWQGNEIIVKKKKVRVKRKDVDQEIKKEDTDRPISNPLPPQSEAFADYNSQIAVSAQQLLENAAQEIPNFGTEQDKAHCPFHLKTGACRFGIRCSRVHFYPDKSCTLLIKNMYNGPGLAWEQDEGLEYTDEEVERCYEEFYEDVHTEFLKFGEIVNFKVCKNGSFHLRGNVYVHYRSLESALLAYQSINGRYFAGKQVKCEFVGVTKWRSAICGEYMKSRLKTCSHGTACNFIHCFRNPGGDYEWADWDKPPPKYWVKKMAALFGYSEEYVHDNHTEQEKMIKTDRDRQNSRRSLSRERDSSRSQYKDNDVPRRRHSERHRSGSRRATEVFDEKNCGKRANINNHRSKRREHESDSDEDFSNKDRSGDRYYELTRKRIRNGTKDMETQGGHGNSIFEGDSDGYQLDLHRERDRHCSSKRKGSCHKKKKPYGILDDYDGNNRTDGTDSIGQSSDQDRHMYHSKRRKSSRYENKMYPSPRSSSREDDGDRYLRHGIKSLKHSNEKTGFIGDSDNLINLEDKYCGRESYMEKLEPRVAKEHHCSSREDSSSMQRSKAKLSGEVLKSDRYCWTENEQWSSQRSKSHDSGPYSVDDVDIRGRWEPDKSGPGKHHKSRGNSHADNFDRYGGDSNSHDERNDGSRSVDSGQSSHGKNLDGSEEADSAEHCRESKEAHKKHYRYYRVMIVGVTMVNTILTTGLDLTSMVETFCQRLGYSLSHVHPLSFFYLGALLVVRTV
ncbi:hypothetical protein NMG60_11036664 [Bertholletia excelsa]